MSCLQELKNSKVGQTVYILGNGPSLGTLDVADLLNKDTFWVNRAYFIKDKFNVDFKPKYYIVTDPNVIRLYGDDVIKVEAENVFMRGNVYTVYREMYPDHEFKNLYVFPLQRNAHMFKGDFPTDLTKGTVRTYTVVLDAVQVAFYMGYKQVLIGGVDLDYDQQTGPYFFDSEPKNRPKVFMPMRKVRKGFIVAKKFYEKHGRSMRKITDSPNLPLRKIEL